MPKLTFDEAQKALGHLQSPNQGDRPPLLQVKGWDKSKKIYHLKNDIERAFKAEIDRFKDLLKERQQLQQKKQQSEQFSSYNDKIQEINNEINDLFQQEEEVELTGEKLTEEEFGDVIDTGMFLDLEFAISMNGKPDTN